MGIVLKNVHQFASHVKGIGAFARREQYVMDFVLVEQGIGASLPIINA